MHRKLFCLTGLFLLLSLVSAQTIIRGPYLQIPTETSIRIRYRTSTPAPTQVELGTDLTSLTVVYNSLGNTIDHEALITGLQPNTRYYYALLDAGNYMLPADSSHSFRTPPLAGTPQPVRAWILGDCGTGNNNARAVRDAYYSYLDTQYTDLVLMLGDNAYNSGTDAEYQTAVFQNMYEEILRKTPLLPTPGNHEFYNGGTFSGTETGPYFDIFSLPKNGEMGGLASGTEAYYSFDYGNIHFVSLDSYDSDRSPAGPMLTWLSNDLAATNQDWIVAFFHHPPYTKGSHDSDNPLDSGGRMAEMRQNVLPILESFGVDLVLSGHSHSYERSFLVKDHYGTSGTLTPAMIVDGGDGQAGGDGAYQKTSPVSPGAEGAVYITAGSSGKIGGGSLNHPLMFASFNLLGSCVLEVDSNQLEVKFLTSTGTVADSFQIEKNFGNGSPPSVSLVNPPPGLTLPAPQSLTLQSIATDTDGMVVSVEYFVNGISVGLATVPPFDLAWNIPANGFYQVYALAWDDSLNQTTSAIHSLTIGPLGSSQFLAINSSADDAEESLTGSVNLTSTDMELCNDPMSGAQLVALRFSNVNIPPNAVVDSAFLQFTVDELTNINPSVIVIFGEDHFNSPPITNTPGNLSDRRRTDTLIYWSPPAWNSQGQAGAAQRSPDLSGILQEVVNLPGWQAGNAVTLLLAGWGRRVAESFDGTAPPELALYFTPAPPPVNLPPTVEILSPRDSLLLGALGNVAFEVQTTDPAGYVERVRFYVDGSLVANDSIYPFGTVLNLNQAGTYTLVAEVVDDGGLTETDTVRVSVDTSLHQLTQTFVIATGQDDAEEYQNGAVQLNNPQLEIARQGVYNLDDQTVGLRFRQLGIPEGSTILSAQLQFTTSAGNMNRHPIDLRIYGEGADDSPVFVSLPGNLSSRNPTTESVRWIPPIWTTVNQAGSAQQSPDLRHIIQEIVDRPGWEADNALTLLIEGTGGRPAFAYEAGPSVAPRLQITYVPLPAIVRGPYLQLGTDTSIVVRFRTNLPVQTRLHYGTDPANLNQTFSGSPVQTDHEFQVGGLAPGTRYYYALWQGSDTLLAPSSNLYWRTAPSAGTPAPLRAWILGDAGTADHNARAVRDAYYAYVDTQHTDLLLMLGDNAYDDGTDAEYQVAVFENMYEDLLQQTVLWPTPGNHEFDNGATSSATETGPYYDIFTLPRQGEAGGLASGTEAYYAFDYGNVHFISMDSHDSDRSSSGDMLTWLENDLAATEQDWIVAYFHHPPYSKGSHDSDNPGDSGGRMRDMRQNALPILESYGADLVLSGHSHSYERSYLLNGHYGPSSTLTPSMILDSGNGQEGGDGAYQKSKQDSLGTVYITAGSSGKTSGGPLNHPVMYASFNSLGSCLLEVDSNRLSLRFLTASGVVADSFVMEKTVPPLVLDCAPLDNNSLLELWFRGDREIWKNNGLDMAEAGDSVSRWTNQGRLGGEATQLVLSEKPTFGPGVDSLFNGNGYLRFSGLQSLEVPDGLQENSFHLFLVQRSDQTATQEALLGSDQSLTTPGLFLFKDDDEYKFRQGNDDNVAEIKIGSDKGSGPKYHIVEVYHDHDTMGGALDGNAYGTQAQTPDNDSDGQILGLRLGADPEGNLDHFNHEIAELMAFSRKLTPAERKEVLSHLAIRYAISIPREEHLYYDIETFDHRITGIGQDDSTQCLLQISSLSVEEKALVRISAPDDLQAGEYLTWGDDDKGTSIVTQAPVGISGRMGRVFRLRKTGEVGQYAVTFDLTGLNYDFSLPTQYALLESSRPNFAFSSVANGPVPMVQGERLTYSGISMQDSAYFTLGIREGVALQARVFLQGPFEAGVNLMRDGLRTRNLIPLQEPYTALPDFSPVGTGGGERIDPSVLVTSGNDAIVDWVYLELRSSVDTTIVATRAALLQRDGDIVEVDGSAAVFFPAVSADSYFVVIRHRNHLGVMSEQPYALSNTPVLLDFADGSVPSYGTHAQKALTAGISGLWAGDTNGDGRVIFQGGGNDPAGIFLKVLTSPGNAGFARNWLHSGYERSDVNLDGTTIFQGSNTDTTPIFLNVFTHPLNTGFNRNFVVQGQVP